MTNRSTIIVRVHTTDGIVGEAYVGDEDASLLEIEGIIGKEISPRLVGLDIFATERCWEAALPATFDILRDRRLGLVAVAGTDAAIGMRLAKPWASHSGACGAGTAIGFRSSRSAAITPSRSERSLRRSPSTKSSGSLASNSRWEAPPPKRTRCGSPAQDKRRAMTSLSRSTPIRDSRSQRPSSLPPGRGHEREVVRGARPLAERSSEPAGRPATYHDPRLAGQSEHSPSGCRDLMEAGAIDVCNFHSSWSGGPTAWRRVAAIALSYDVQMGHHEEPQIASHLLASQPHGTYAECFHPARDPVFWNIIANPPQLDDGDLVLGSRPGLGWDLDWDYIERHRVQS